MSNGAYKIVEGGVTAAEGFRASGVCAGIKASGADLALLVSDVPATVAGVFTTNAVVAAPVKLCREVLAAGKGHGQAVVINSGCANACTGTAGMEAARTMATCTAQALGIPAAAVFVCSTGTIGKKLPLERICAGIPLAQAALAATGGAAAARAIMTTDTVDKQYAVAFEIGGRRVHVGGMAKGAGMIEPDMATMLAFITTDAAVEPDALQCCLAQAANGSFNRISVDGDQSTNDTLLMFANGQSGAPVLEASHADWDRFCEAVHLVARELAHRIVRDGEGATRFVSVTVEGAATAADALTAARAVANSLLCKTAWFGGDPNWGRLICAVGYSGARVDAERVDIQCGDVLAVKDGQMAPGTAFSDLEAVFARPHVEIRINLNLGDAADTVYTCDCSDDYVRINAEYMT